MRIETLTDTTRGAAAAHALANAFYDDPMMRYLLEDPTRRRSVLPLYFDAVVRLTSKAGVQRTGVDDLNQVCATAIAMPPDTYPLPTLPQLAEWRPIIKSGWRGTLRHFRDLPAIENRRPREPYWYLMFIGVDPPAQGAGFGAALINAVLADADRDDLPTYLVTMKKANIAWYGRFGFEAREELQMGKRGPATWTMLRPPASSRADSQS